MAEETHAEVALDAARARVKRLNETNRVSPESLITLADVEVRAEQARQQELANLIALMATPAACPFPARDVLDRIKELVRL